MELMETNVMSELARTKDDLSTTLVENEVLEAQIDNLQTMNKQIKTCLHNLQKLVDIVEHFADDILPKCNE